MTKFVYLTLLSSTLLFASCKKEGCTDPDANNYAEKAKKDDGSCTYDAVEEYATQKTALKATYAKLAFAVYSDAYDLSVDLNAAIQNFVSNPTSTNFEAAKQAWLDAREPYGQSEIFRFVEGPIDNASDGPEGLINAWPMDEAYVDYVQGNANAGIINDLTTYPTIDINTLVSANEFGGETNISVGYHAIEFLLWGQDMSATSAGTRPYTDYVDGGTAANQDRRRTYLSICGNLLVEALEQVKNAWDPNNAAGYYSEWMAMSNNLALRKMFNSIRVMSGFELSGERIYTAYDNQDQEDEHSCFSDNTHRDIALNALGIKNLYTGTYTHVNGQVISGFGLKDLVAIVDPTRNTQMLNQLQEAENKIAAMYTPFDQAIVLPNERPKVLEAVYALVGEETIILEIAEQNFNIKF